MEAVSEGQPSLFEQLIEAVEEEIDVLRKIDQEEQREGSKRSTTFYVERLTEMHGQMQSDNQLTDPEAISKQARFWGQKLGSIYRLVDARYPDSVFGSEKDRIEDKIDKLSEQLIKGAR